MMLPSASIRRRLLAVSIGLTASLGITGAAAGAAFAQPVVEDAVNTEVVSGDAEFPGTASSDASIESLPTISNPAPITIGEPVKQQLHLSAGARIVRTPIMPEGLFISASGLVQGTAAPNAGGEHRVQVRLADDTYEIWRDLVITLVGQDYNVRTLTREVPWLGSRQPNEQCPASYPWLRNEAFPGHSVPRGIAVLTSGGAAIRISGSKMTDSDGWPTGIQDVFASNIGGTGVFHLVLHCTNDRNMSYK